MSGQQREDAARDMQGVCAVPQAEVVARLARGFAESGMGDVDGCVSDE